MQKYEIQETIQYTSYREQYTILVTENNTKIPATGNTKYQLHGTIQNTSY
jgi:hypothetical protein